MTVLVVGNVLVVLVVDALVNPVNVLVVAALVAHVDVVHAAPFQ